MISSLFSLEGKVALVTGSSRGIGKATALGFAEAGADVVVTSRKLPDLEMVAEEIRDMGRKSLPVACHVGRMDQIKSLVETVVAEFGKIDILVNNAGTSPVGDPAMIVEERAWDVIMNLNLKGLFFLSQSVARVMKEHGGGKIVNVASVDAYRPELNAGIYSISKAGVVMATKVMAGEWAKHNIRVNCIAPGAIETRLYDAHWFNVPEEMKKAKVEVAKKIPAGYIGQPDDIAGAMIYLASDASNYMTGETIIIDGGIMLVQVVA